MCILYVIWITIFYNCCKNRLCRRYYLIYSVQSCSIELCCTQHSPVTNTLIFVKLSGDKSNIDKAMLSLIRHFSRIRAMYIPHLHPKFHTTTITKTSKQVLTRLLFRFDGTKRDRRRKLRCVPVKT